MTLEYDTIRNLARLSDPVGVLSVYATIDPSAEAKEPPAWQLRIRNRLDELLAEAERDRPGDYARALRRSIDNLRGELGQALSADRSGRGRALFATLGTGEVQQLYMQLELGDHVVCDDSAHVKPLLDAWARGSPAGIVVAAGDDLRIVDYRFEDATQIEAEEFREPTSEWRTLKGPPNSNPAHLQQPGSQRDLFDNRLLEHQRKFLAARHDTVEQHARERGWEFLVVTGEPHLRDAVFDSLADLPGCDKLRADHTIGPATADRIAEIVAPDLDAARQRRDEALVHRALERKKVAWGLDETLQAAQDGQAATVLMRRDARWRGSTTDTGHVVPPDVLPPGTEPDELRDEPDVAERLISLAFDKGATVALLRPDTAAPLDEADGFAALLRW